MMFGLEVQYYILWYVLEIHFTNTILFGGITFS